VKRVAVVGGGPAGMACAVTAAARGHRVTLFEAAENLGGQFLLARNIPGKEEFAETLRYFSRQIELHGVDLRLGHRATIEDVRDFDQIVMASGVVPRKIEIPGAEMDHVFAYNEVIGQAKKVGDRVAIIGAGGIGFDVASLLLHREHCHSEVADFMTQWGVDTKFMHRGGLGVPMLPAPPRQVHMFQRKRTKPGLTLGKTTGWIHRLEMKKYGVKFWTGVEYLSIDQSGLWIKQGDEDRLVVVDSVVICAGQEPELGLAAELDSAGISYHLIGGAFQAAELDAQRAIAQGTKVADSF